MKKRPRQTASLDRPATQGRPTKRHSKEPSPLRCKSSRSTCGLL
jgi:hypothetical protein